MESPTTTVECPARRTILQSPVACLLHELARDIVDCSDMVGIESVTQTESVGEEGCSQQGRIVMKGDQCPEPRGKIACNEQHIHAKIFLLLRLRASLKSLAIVPSSRGRPKI